MVDTISVRVSIAPAMIIHSSFNLLNFRFDAEDCTNEEELPDFSPLSDFSLHPELQVK